MAGGGASQSPAGTGGSRPIDPVRALVVGNQIGGILHGGKSRDAGTVQEQRNLAGQTPGSHVIDRDPNAPDGNGGSALRSDIRGLLLIAPRLEVH